MPDNPLTVIGGDIFTPIGIVPPPANITALDEIESVDPLWTTCIAAKLLAEIALIADAADPAVVANVALLDHELVPNNEPVIPFCTFNEPVNNVGPTTFNEPVTRNEPVINAAPTNGNPVPDPPPFNAYEAVVANEADTTDATYEAVWANDELVDELLVNELLANDELKLNELETLYEELTDNDELTLNDPDNEYDDDTIEPKNEPENDPVNDPVL